MHSPPLICSVWSRNCAQYNCSHGTLLFSVTLCTGERNADSCLRSEYSVIKFFDLEADLCKDKQFCQRDEDCRMISSHHTCECSSLCGLICTEPLQPTSGKYPTWIPCNYTGFILSPF